jgi:hypothetical protein
MPDSAGRVEVAVPPPLQNMAPSGFTDAATPEGSAYPPNRKPATSGHRPGTGRPPYAWPSRRRRATRPSSGSGSSDACGCLLVLVLLVGVASFAAHLWYVALPLTAAIVTWVVLRRCPCRTPVAPTRRDG